MKLCDLPIRIVRPLGSDTRLATKSNPRGINRTAIKNAVRRQRIYDVLLMFHKRQDSNQTANAIADASGVKLSYCQSDLIELRDKYKFVCSSERQRVGSSWTQRLWWAIDETARTVYPVGI